uniref:J domain-containing protein n=1 Tax=Odontella aurita TaxID=265563 RepID=A0A7S4I752_9STRA
MTAMSILPRLAAACGAVEQWHPRTAAPQRLTAAASYFTNTDRMKRSDPYAPLGLTWGATLTEIKEAFRQKARELHPDVNTSDAPGEALRKFQELQKTYQKLMDVRGATHAQRDDDEWSFAVWRTGDIIAQERTDVAGEAVKRPSRPAAAQRNQQWGIAALGHPDGGGNARRRAEYLTDGGEKKSRLRSSTVGTGRNKWVKPKEFKPWNPKDVKVKAAAMTDLASIGTAKIRGA